MRIKTLQENVEEIEQGNCEPEALKIELAMAREEIAYLNLAVIYQEERAEKAEDKIKELYIEEDKRAYRDKYPDTV